MTKRVYTVEEMKAAMDSLVAKGFMVDNGDGTYSPTPLGRLVAEQSGTTS